MSTSPSRGSYTTPRDTIFLCVLLRSQYFQRFIASASRSAQAGFNKGDLAAINFPMPPIGEQHRIVAKVDELTMLCDRLEASLAAGDGTRGHLLNALIAEALTPDGRELKLASSP